MAGAVVLIDLMYASVGIAGLGQAVDGGWMRVAFGVPSAAVLVVFGVRTAWAGLSARAGLESEYDDVVLPRHAFLTPILAMAVGVARRRLARG